MSKPNWQELRSQFAAAYASSGISPKEWCEQQGLNYESARRYIKKPAQIGAQKKTAQKIAQNADKAKTGQGKVKAGAEKKRDKRVPITSVSFADLSERERIFVARYLEHRDKYKAYREAGYTGGDRAARMLYRKPLVARAINQGIERLTDLAILNAQDVLMHWHEIAVADPGEIAQMRRVCCRHCWGENFLYQWRDVDEYDKAAAKASADSRPTPEYGGLGFIQNDDPNPDCPKCAGEGIEDVFYADTRDVIGPARRLIAGVKKTKFGIEVMTRDQDAALKNLAAFHSLASSEQERELRLLEIERIRLSNEKIKVEIENLRNGKKDGELIVVHNALQVPGAFQPTNGNDEDE